MMKKCRMHRKAETGVIDKQKKRNKKMARTLRCCSKFPPLLLLNVFVVNLVFL